MLKTKLSEDKKTLKKNKTKTWDGLTMQKNYKNNKTKQTNTT